MALIAANKAVPSSSRGQPAKRRSMDALILVNRGKKAAVPLPVRDVRHDQVGHLPDPQHDKNRCRLCGMTCRMKCKIYLCTLPERNCFVNFHTP